MNENVYGWKFKIDDKIQINFFNGSNYTPFHATIQGFTSNEYLENNSYFVGLLIPEKLIKQVYPDTDLTRFYLSMLMTNNIVNIQINRSKIS